MNFITHSAIIPVIVVLCVVNYVLGLKANIKTVFKEIIAPKKWLI